MELDVAYVIGAAAREASKHFDVMKRIGMKLLDSYTISATGTRIGVVLYGSDAYVAFPMDRYSNKATLSEGIRELNRLPSGFDGADIDEALKVAYTKLLSTDSQGRKDVPKTLILGLIMH